jgi:hypothetical protein
MCEPGTIGPSPSLKDEPMSERAPIVLPWKPPQKLTISYLPVCDLARRSALSTASAPLE